MIHQMTSDHIRLTVKWKHISGPRTKHYMFKLGFFVFTYLYICVSIRWVEEDPKEIMQSVYECIERTCEKLQQRNIDISNIKGVLHWYLRLCADLA